MLSLKGTGWPPQRALRNKHFGHGGVKDPPLVPAFLEEIVVEYTPRLRPTRHHTLELLAECVAGKCGKAALTGTSSNPPTHHRQPGPGCGILDTVAEC